VDSLRDTVDPIDARTTLREAIQNANSLPGPAMIVFAPDLSGGRLEFTSPFPIESDLEIDASALAARLTIAVAQPNPDHRHFTIVSGVRATLRGMSLVDGDQTGGASGKAEVRGGAIYSLGSLTLVQPDSDASNDSDHESTSIQSALDVDVAPLTTRPALDAASGLLRQTVRITNHNQQEISPFTLRIAGLPADVTLEAGITADRVHFHELIAPGQSVDVLIGFSRANGDPDFAPAYLLDLYPAELPAGEVQFSEIELLPGGELLLRWASNAGHFYAIQESANLIDWTTIASGLLAETTRTEWTDPAPPITPDPPGARAGKYYRVLQDE
jgi:hypothetical protein